MLKQNKIVTDNDDGTFGVQEYCAGCGRDMGVSMYESIEMANRSVDGISKIYCQECGGQFNQLHINRIPTKKELHALRRDGVVM